MSSLATLCLMLAMCLHIGLAQECDDGYEVFAAVDTSRYKLPPFRLDWADAVVACQIDGGGAHLVIINSDEEAEVVKELVGRLNGTNYPYAWVGINDIGTEGTWLTVQGGLLSATGYAKWGAGQPDGDRAWNCGLVLPDALYHDYPCSYALPFVCEKPKA